MDAFTRIDRRRERLGAVDGRRCHNGAHLEMARRCAVDGVKCTQVSMDLFKRVDVPPSEMDGASSVSHHFSRFLTTDVFIVLLTIDNGRR